ncbi:MAG: hypothetical protein Tp1111SUR761211_7 [Prokaryotic dsDNA virus sp.]|nr:MAG: hypothetical protein Tp1111SUR761211_7 [Prokaryotic dsDNA virus sp.]|tara:strand:- start:4770 stop:5396 length:627 start_codon:yes stop_codon:yes gene_type:complete
MAKQVINIGTTANDGTGDPIRDAFDKVNDNFTELYSDDAGDVGSIVAGTGISVNQATGDVTVTNSSPNATHTGDVTGSGALTIAADAVTHDKLENRYTASATITSTSGATSVDWSTATVFKMQSACTGAKEFDFTNYKVGQVITIHNLTGAYAITLDSDAATSETFNKLGAKDYDGSTTNALMVECIDDSANAIFNYSILTYTGDPTP